jgi:hypothetical protein
MVVVGNDQIRLALNGAFENTVVRWVRGHNLQCGARRDEFRDLCDDPDS